MLILATGALFTPAILVLHSIEHVPKQQLFASSCLLWRVRRLLFARRTFILIAKLFPSRGRLHRNLRLS
jgi:hypothetical protein